MHFVVRAAAGILLLCATVADAYRLDPVVTLAARQGDTWSESQVQPLSGNRFVAAWTFSGYGFGAEKFPARARVFSSQGAALTGEVACTEEAGDSFMRSPQLATTLSGHIIFGCNLERRSGLPVATLRTFSDTLEPVGRRTTYRSDLFSSIDGIASVDEDSFVVTIEEWLPDLSESTRHHRLSLDGDELGAFGFPRFWRPPVAHGDRFLMLAPRGSIYDTLAIRKRLLSGTGEKLGRIGRVFRSPATPWIYTGAYGSVHGAGGRTAIFIQTPPIENVFRLFDKVRVVLVDGDDAGTTHKRDVALPGFHYLQQGAANVWALPLESGFLVLWSREESWEDLIPPLHGVWLQRFTEAGTRVGQPVPMLPGPVKLGQPALDSDGETYLIPMERRIGEGFALEVRRLSSETACGDVDGDGGVTQVDAAALAASLQPDAETCDPCVCDVDRSGTVDAVDIETLVQSVNRRTPLECPACAN